MAWIRRLAVTAATAVAGSIMAGALARATVTQVDGTIIPLTAALQTYLDAQGEGGAPAATAINAQLDASQFPEIFLPNTTIAVQFRDVGEGAGYENTFGWYNVGDDVVTAAGRARNLHPIFGCGGLNMVNGAGEDPAAMSDATLLSAPHDRHHHGDPATFVVNAEEGSLVTVNFAAEQAAGRYKGGYIAFYLVTPEGNPSAVNCGDVKSDSGGVSLYGRIYYSQADLNDDGDFVHNLVYTSKRTANRYYFGFEDLFRGGDNDFEDMLTQVTGLMPPCAPETEVCDGLDNDCDGLVDAADPTLSGTGAACQCDGSAGLTCQGGNRLGECRTGVTVCAAGGAIQCQSTVAPAAETCDGQDDNCDGTVDDNPAGAGVACDGSDSDLCNEGVTVCTAGAMSCNDATGPNGEVCNGADDDCDGTTDEGNPGGGFPCDGLDGDLCAEGVTACSGGGVVCNDATGTTVESCDGVDNDCDGATDEGNPGGGVACDGADADLCNEGVTVCSGGAVVCGDATGPNAELCNDLDDDCDGWFDEGDPGGGVPCDGLDGDLCAEGVTVCSSGAVVCNDATGTTTETCNGLDDDCDGAADEGNPGGGVPCDGADADLCNEGVTACSGGAVVCGDATGPSVELCNGADDDCDGTADEGDPGGGVPCDGLDGDLCNEGVTVCSGGAVVCGDATGTAAESCNGLDDDCDGVVDEGNPGGGVACDGPDADLCTEGVTACSGGTVICTDTSGPTAEVCNGADDDCDGATDEGNPGGGVPCDGLDGDLCNEGVTVCSGGAVVCDDATGTTLETCNGLDDDCDGAVDDGNPGGGVPCDGADADLCNEGTTACSGGIIVCSDTSGPTAELCNGLDDDCDGATDEGNPGGGAACDGLDGDLCPEGITICSGGAIVCDDATGTAVESCNGLDDDCDGVVDDGNPGGGLPCDGADADLCNEGFTVCSGGVVQCGDVTGPSVEACNGADDDCDGVVDDGDPGGGVPCDGGDGDACLEGATACVGGAIVCGDATATETETCNGLDDDCNGVVDDAPSGLGVACTVGVGECARSGATICAGGVPVCNVSPGAPSSEKCNGVDDDCDGAIDDGYDVGAPCDGVGACGLGAIECDTLTSTRCSTDPGGSMDGSGTEVCNGLDDDCDGATDEGLNDLGPCGTDAGECAEGRLRCLGGAPVCQGAIAPTPEVCDGDDNDCDGLADERTGDPGDVGGGLVDEGASCGDDTGECEFGALVCTAGVPSCEGGVGPTPELCNGLDDDCTGVADDDPVDVDQPCGATTVGVCELGLTICLAGAVTCNGEIGPVAETCNTLDDDCDGAVDDDPLGAGAPCGSTLGVCEPGSLVCTAGAMTCVGATGGAAELCNGLDDDCDGVIDDSPGDVGGPCGSAIGECEPGAEFCISGMKQCVGGVTPATEICNSLDDDCDGNVDEGDLCSGGTCIDGECALPCGGVEFDCPPGKTCEEGWCVDDPCAAVTCVPQPDGTLMTCVGGVCVTKCSTVSCTAPDVCRATDGICVPDDCRYLPDKCGEGEYCQAGACVTDLCADTSCDADDFCRDGACVESCAGVTCGETERCHDGACVPTGCAVRCPPPSICDAATGECVADPCVDLDCEYGEVCDPQLGECIPDPCAGIDCPAGQVCDLGDCFAPEGPPGAADAGPPEAIYATGGGGCAVGGRGGRPLLGGLLLVGAAVAAAGRRRRWAALLLLALALGACDVDPYYLTADGAPGAGGDAPAGDGGATGDGGPTADAGCVFGAPELCNGVDDNCNEVVDEGFDLGGDELNCGECGRTCAKTGSRTECMDSACVIHECFPGNVDLDGDLGEPFGDSNGCEYACFVSNGGVEACDTLDNDCDGEIDEDTLLLEDEANCGSCGHVCGFFMATTSCVAGDCVFDPATDCAPGFHDVNGAEFDGCEYACTVTGGGVESCDFLDNDCDGVIDESFDPSMDPAHCGVCGRVCEFAHATPHCTLGTCGFDPAVDCLPGWHDVNGNQLDGCEYPCTATGPDLCNGLDDDCDGAVDGATADSGGACTNAPSGAATGVCTATGTVTCVAAALRCVGAPEPESERCDGLDNDCDGATDDAPVDVGAVCQAPVGNCTAGLFSCVGGALLCVQAVGPAPELCNGLDDDCDGTTDDLPTDPGLGLPCGTDAGECAAGLAVCAAGAVICVGETPPSDELCNGLDDDCDGAVDNSPIDAAGACGSDAGACVPGTEECVDGAVVCVGGVTPVAELCNAIDDDCNGTADEAVTTSCYDGPAGTSGVGACQPGTAACTAGAFGPCVGEVVPAAEACNAVDDDCDSSVDEGITQSCYTGPAGTAGVGRCAPGAQGCAAGVFGGPCAGEVLPGAESCNNIDDDCDAAVDDGVTQTCYTGPAGTAGVGVCAPGTQACSAGAFSGPCLGQVTPGAEACNALDDDCDTSVDEGVTQSCYTGPAGTLGVGACAPGSQACAGGTFSGPCAGQITPAGEACNNVDDDCDAVVDDGVTQSCYTGPAGTAGVGACAPGTQTCSAGAFSGPCVGQITPAIEACNNVDDDCDSAVDESVQQACYTGPAGTLGIGACASGTATCAAGVFGPCGGQVTPAAESCNAVDDDCDASVDEGVTQACYTGPSGTLGVGSCASGTQTCSGGAFSGPCVGQTTPAAEACNNLDDDCDATTDEGVTQACYTGPGGTLGVGACAAGTQTCTAGSFGGPCVGQVTPGTESCNNSDDDCDGAIDESVTQACYTGPGGTLGVGVCATGTQTCSAGAFSGPCVGQVTPGGESCNNADDDCDGAIDESVVQACYTGPGGTLGVGACAAGTRSCSAGAFTGPCVGQVTPGGESCNNIDDDCDGAIDESVTQACYTGPGGTLGIGACAAGTQTCSAGAFSGPCVGQLTPGGESCNNVDDDCDGAVDESVTQACYTGPGGTLGVGACAAGTQSCSAGGWGGCGGQVLPGGESCNNLDDDCDGMTDESAGGAPLAQSCFTGPGTAGVGTCAAGTQTCSVGAWGVCAGQVTAVADRCGDGLDSDCDGLGDVAEGCLATVGAEFRLDTPGGAEGSTAGQFHSFDVRVATAGSPTGRNVYVVWSDNKNGATDVFLRRSTDGGSTWQDVQNLTGAVTQASVVPVVVAAWDGTLGADRVTVVYQRVTAGVRGIYAIRSVNSGATFADPASGTQLSGAGAIDCFHHDVALSGSGQRLVVAWEQLATTGTPTRNVVSRASTDYGQNYQAARTVTVASGAAPVAGRPQVAVTNGGRFVFVWREIRAPRITYEVYANWSNDATTALAAGDERRLDGDTLDQRQSDRPQLVVVESNAYVVWEDTSALPGGGSDVVFARSTDAGTSWAAERILDDPSGEVSSSFVPSLDVDPGAAAATDDVVYVVWVDDREGSQIYAARSTDAGATWPAAQRASSQGGAPAPGVSRKPTVAFVGGGTAVVSYENDGLGIFHVYAAATVDGGATWQTTDPRLDGGPGPTQAPVVARVNGGGITIGAIVAWIDFRSGTGINGDPYRMRIGR